MIELTNRQARQFLLLKHGLLGPHRFSGKPGVLDYVRQAGCIQYDPVDVCGKNAELVLQSRINGFSKTALDELLYTDRSLVDYPDKNLAIIPVTDWPCFERYRLAARHRGAEYPQLAEAMQTVQKIISIKGPVCSDDLEMTGELSWRSAIHWSGSNKISRAVLEQMYSSGDLVIHHKNRTRKYYDLADRHIPSALLNAEDPLPDDRAHRQWRVFRRIGAVGLLWNRPSDAWLNIWGLDSAGRNAIFANLLADGLITEISVSGIKNPLFCQTADMPLLEIIRKKRRHHARCELIAPLDNLLWDRKLIKALFDFSYTWEIYTPPAKRQYGSYVLPLLYGEEFAGRLEAAVERKTGTLVVKNLWLEADTEIDNDFSAALDDCLKRFAAFNNCRTIEKTGHI